MLKNFLMVVILVVIVGAAVEGSIYAKNALQAGSAADADLQTKQNALGQRQKSDAEISSELISARATLAAQAAKLAVMQASYDPDAYASFLVSQETLIAGAIKDTNALFKDPDGVDPVITIKTSSQTIAASIDSLRKQVNQLINTWEAGQSPASYNTIVQYIDQLQDIVSGLTPENSGLTQQQIDQYQQDVAQAQDSINNAGNGSTGDNTGGSSDVVTPQEIQDQQNTVDDSQQNVNDLQNQLDNSGNGGTGGSSGGNPVGDNGDDSSGSPAGSPGQTSGPVQTQPGRPTLIQGTNTF